MKLAILDDWFDTLRGLPCFARLDGIDVTVFTDHEPDVDRLAARLQGFDAVVLFRERTAITRQLVEKLPDLKLISQRSVYPHIDVEACTEHNILVCSNMSGGVSHAAAEMTWALMLSALRDIPRQMASLRAGGWQTGVGRSAHGRQIGIYGYGRIGRQVADYADAFGMKVVIWGSEEGRARATADGRRTAASRKPFCGKRRCQSSCAPEAGDARSGHGGGSCDDEAGIGAGEHLARRSDRGGRASCRSECGATRDGRHRCLRCGADHLGG